MSNFTVRKFADIPKIVGRGAKPGAGRPSIYPFSDLKEVGDGFDFESVLTKKVRGAVQAYRANFPAFKFAIRELRNDDGTPSGRTACILHKVLTAEEVAAAESAKAAQKAAEKEAEAKLVAATQVAPAATAAVVSASVDDALAGLDI